MNINFTPIIGWLKPIAGHGTPKRTEFPRRIRSVSSPTRHGAARVHRAPTMRRRRSRGRPGPGQRCVPGGPVRPDSKT